MFKKLLSIIVVLAIAFTITGCGNSNDTNNSSALTVDKKIEPYKYEQQEFEIAGLWAPHQITEEAFVQYKNAGFNVFSFTNHDAMPRSSENQYYLGSKRSLEALELCKKVGLDVYVAYGNSWYVHDIEGAEYFEGTPFSNHDVYGEYKDIIKGMHIKDEPNKETMTELSSDVLINDFKKVFPNTKYIVNLIPETAVQSRDYENYTELLEHYGEGILSKFENPHVSVDCYLHSNNKQVGFNILKNYIQLARCAKKYNATTSMILQSSTGNEFVETLNEADMRQQVYLALAFGADSIQYYCYSVPTYYSEDGSKIDGYLYNHCMLNQDGTPNQLYYDVKAVNEEIQKFSSAILAYNWDNAIGISGTNDQTFRVCSIEYDENLNIIDLKDTKHYVSASGTLDLVLSRFTSEKYGEAYMFVNFGTAEQGDNTVSAKFKDCKKLAIYGGEGYSGTPKIIELDKDGNFELTLKYGEGVFVTPIA